MVLGQLVTHIEQKVNLALDSRSLKNQLEKDHGAMWETESQSFWKKTTGECLRDFCLGKAF